MAHNHTLLFLMRFGKLAAVGFEKRQEQSPCDVKSLHVGAEGQT